MRTSALPEQGHSAKALHPLFVVLAACALTLALAACGGEETPEECQEGEGCPCRTLTDCPSPLTEECFGAGIEEGICVARGSMDDTGSDTDPPDTPDAGDTEDPDAEDTEDTEDTADTDPDTEAGTDTDTDAEAGTDIDTDAEVDTDTDLPDTEVDTDTDLPDTDTGTPSGDYDGWVAYEESRSGLAFVVSSDRTEGPHTLPGEALPSGLANGPDFSPDGTQIAYGYNSTEGSTLRIFNLSDGSHVDYLGDASLVAVTRPDWSPDGTQIALRGKTTDTVNVFNILIYDFDTDGLDAITDITDDEVDTRFVSAPSWSADGTKIYYVGGTPGAEGGESDVWVMNADGTGAEQLTFGHNPFGGVTVRADGNEIMFRSSRPETQAHVRFGVNPTPPEGAIPFNGEITVGEFDIDNGCDYFGHMERAVCTRRVGGVNDIVVVDLGSGATLINLTATTESAEALPNASSVPYTDTPLTLPD